MNKEDSNNELNNFYVDEIIKNKEVSHETGEYNEIKISNGLIKASEEESSSSEEKESTSKALSLTTTLGMTVGVGGIVVGSIASLTLSLNLLFSSSVVGISKAECYFELSNASYETIDIQLENEVNQQVQLVDLKPTEKENYYVAEFNDLSPNSTYYLKGINEKGEVIELGKNNSFKTLEVPNYDITIDKSRYNKENGDYILSFKIDNPNNYLLEAKLICENDFSLNHEGEFNGEVFNIVLPTILSSYRLELYQENYLVGQTSFCDYEGFNVIDDFLYVGISSLEMVLNYGEIDVYNIDVFLEKKNNPEEIIELQPGPDGDALYVYAYNLEPETSYNLKINDANRHSFNYFTYSFETISVPKYEIIIDDSSFDKENNNYVLTFNIDNPKGYLIDANLYCLNDETYNNYYLITDNTLTLTLPTLYSKYRLDLTQEGYEVGSKIFSYYKPIELLLDTLDITSNSFSVEISLGDVPLDNTSFYLKRSDNLEEERPLEISLIDNSSNILLEVNDLNSDTSYILEIRDPYKDTTVYLNYAFDTLA